mmetsp:Transcript_47730/g.102290  ORF Transcript_47730/g.102290 Transcript_47730/m.102290 type:complete len:103 (+) Transcript_47730:271-579(+)
MPQHRLSCISNNCTSKLAIRNSGVSATAGANEMEATGHSDPNPVCQRPATIGPALSPIQAPAEALLGGVADALLSAHFDLLLGSDNIGSELLLDSPPLLSVE